MKKLREIFWKYFVEKRIPMHPKLEEKKKFAQMSWGVAPKTGDDIGYKLFGIGNFFRYLGIIIFLSLFLILIVGFLFKSLMMAHLFVNLLAVVIGMGIAGGILGMVYEARYKLWIYLGIHIIAVIGLAIISYFLPLKYVVTGIVVYTVLFISLYLFLTFSEGGQDE